MTNAPPEEIPVTSSTSPPALRTWTFDLPMTKPLSMNARQHWAPKSKGVAHVRRMTALMALQKKIPACQRIAVELHYAPRDARRRDPLNLVATLKPVEDGLVDAGVVPDDTEQYVEPTMPKIDPPLGSGAYGRLYVIVRELPAVHPIQAQAWTADRIRLSAATAADFVGDA